MATRLDAEQLDLASLASTAANGRQMQDFHGATLLGVTPVIVKCRLVNALRVVWLAERVRCILAGRRLGH